MKFTKVSFQFFFDRTFCNMRFVCNVTDHRAYTHHLWWPVWKMCTHFWNYMVNSVYCIQNSNDFMINGQSLLNKSSHERRNISFQRLSSWKVDLHLQAPFKATFITIKLPEGTLTTHHQENWRVFLG